MLSAEYAAGLIDGEGSIGAHARTKLARTYYTARVQIGMSLPGLAAMQAMKARWGGSLTMTRPASDRWEEAWTWTCSGPAAAALLAEVLPHLIIKRDQALVALAIETLKATQPRRPNGATEWSMANEATGAALKARLHLMNAKGPRARNAKES